MILAGDIGGTKTNLAAFEDPGRVGTAIAEEQFPSRDSASLDAIVKQFVGKHSLRAPELACFGVAGPVIDGRCVTTNLPWVVDAALLSGELGGARTWLLNDLEATAYGVAALSSHDFVVLNRGAATAIGNAAIIAAGTGLGEAGLYWDGRLHRPYATEGGHASFGPTTDLELELLAWLRPKWEHVSWERVVSGPGLVHIYEFLRDTRHGDEPAWLTAELAGGDPAHAISRAAQEGRSITCEQALDLFVTLYGAEAGNLALKTMSSAGVYIGGGIAPRNVAWLQRGNFMRGFTAKGRMRPLLEAMPVRIILNDRTALLGAARCAALRGGGEERLHAQ
jgi:glucokinase